MDRKIDDTLRTVIDEGTIVRTVQESLDVGRA